MLGTRHGKGKRVITAGQAAPPPPLSTTLFQSLAQQLMWAAAERGREGRKANIGRIDVAARSGGAAGP
jgi:hypothetical protein